MSLTHFIRAPLVAALIALASVASSLPTAALAQASAPAAAVPAPAAAPPAAATAPTVSKEEVTNPYGLEAMWRDGDVITRGTLIIMIIMSMGSWYIIFTKLFEQSKLMRSAKAASESFWSAGSISLVKMMYQLPIDMMTMMISVPRATKSPCFQSASRP